jgi:hypothetical protein
MGARAGRRTRRNTHAETHTHTHTHTHEHIQTQTTLSNTHVRSRTRARMRIHIRAHRFRSSRGTGLKLAGFSEYGWRQAGHRPLSCSRMRFQQKRHTCGATVSTWRERLGGLEASIWMQFREKISTTQAPASTTKGAIKKKKSKKIRQGPGGSKRKIRERERERAFCVRARAMLPTDLQQNDQPP